MLRLCKVFKEEDGKWIQVEMKDLQIGDKFKMFEDLEEKEPVVGLSGSTEWVTTSEPEELKGGNWQVYCEDV